MTDPMHPAAVGETAGRRRELAPETRRSCCQPSASEARETRGDTSRPAARAALPPGCEPYRSTPVFANATIPPGLLREHRTAPGTWALICVLEGRLLYRVLDPPSERVLDPSAAPGLVEPGVPHEIAPLGPVRFQVVFHRIAGPRAGDAAPADSRKVGKDSVRRSPNPLPEQNDGPA